MVTRIVVSLAVLAIMVASAASATTLAGTQTADGGMTTYTYTLTSTELGDFITSLHVFAPLSVDLVRSYTAPENWSFSAEPYSDPAYGTDFCWYSDNPRLYGVGNNSSAVFSLTVPSSTCTDCSRALPGCFGNWGYETRSWPGALLVSFPAVPVPEGVPEPTSLIALAFGCFLTANAHRRCAKR